MTLHFKFLFKKKRILYILGLMIVAIATYIPPYTLTIRDFEERTALPQNRGR